MSRFRSRRRCVWALQLSHHAFNVCVVSVSTFCNLPVAQLHLCTKLSPSDTIMLLLSKVNHLRQCTAEVRASEEHEATHLHPSSSSRLAAHSHFCLHPFTAAADDHDDFKPHRINAATLSVPRTARVMF